LIRHGVSVLSYRGFQPLHGEEGYPEEPHTLISLLGYSDTRASIRTGSVLMECALPSLPHPIW
jgi:hypothetical protein